MFNKSLFFLTVEDFIPDFNVDDILDDDQPHFQSHLKTGQMIS